MGSPLTFPNAVATSQGLFDRTTPQDAPGERSGAVWGVDPSTVRISIATGESRVATHSFTRYPSMSAARHRAIYTETREWAVALAMKFGRPDAVFIEQASGSNVNPPLLYAVGQSLAALAEVCDDIRTIPSGTWKLQGLGYGAAKKWEIMKWAQRRGYTGHLEDEADALGIRAGGVKLLEPKPEQLTLP